MDPAMANGGASAVFFARQRFERVKTAIRHEARLPAMELQRDREANRAMPATPNGARDG